MAIQAVFAANMKKFRKKAKLTQEKLAEICGTDHRYIGQIETGVRCPSLDYVEKIAAALNIAPYHLFYDDTNLIDGGFTVLHREQKQRIKTLLFEDFSRICTIIDEQY
ncbi:MAG: helix-turn-helix transcriptional regulator [Treponema sp.]|nr:helix-turn-helix transcriptional regulator [Treponema sp.]